MHRRRKPFDLNDLVRRSTDGPCFICGFLDGTPGYAHTTGAENDSAVAFLNKYPTLFGSILVAPKQHVEDVTGSFSLDAYLEIQRFVYRVGEAIRHVLKPERLYVLSLGSLAANSHVHCSDERIFYMIPDKPNGRFIFVRKSTAGVGLPLIPDVVASIE